MDITQRYVCAYIVECLTGFIGDSPQYSSLLRNIRTKQGHPLLDGVVEIVKSSGLDPRSPNVEKRVKEFTLEYLKGRENVTETNLRENS